MVQAVVSVIRMIIIVVPVEWIVIAIVPGRSVDSGVSETADAAAIGVVLTVSNTVFVTLVVKFSGEGICGDGCGIVHHIQGVGSRNAVGQRSIAVLHELPCELGTGRRTAVVLVDIAAGTCDIQGVGVIEFILIDYFHRHVTLYRTLFGLLRACFLFRNEVDVVVLCPQVEGQDQQHHHCYEISNVQHISFVF